MRGGLLNFADTGISLVAAVSVSIVIARALGPDRFGLYSLVMSIVMFAYVFARLGINETIRRYVAELHGADRLELVGAVVRHGLRYGVVTAALSALSLAFLSMPLATFFGHSELQPYFLLGALILIPTLLASVFRNVLRGVQQYQYFVRMNLLVSPIWVVSCVLVIRAGAGIVGLLLVGLGLELFQLVLMARWSDLETGWLRSRMRLPDAMRRRLVNFNLAVGGVMVLDLIVQRRFEVIFLGHFRDPSEVSYYTLPFSLTDRVVDLIPGPLIATMLPGFAYTLASREPADFSRLFNGALQWLAMLTLPICIFGIPLAGVLITLLYGPAYASATVVLQILLVAVPFAVLGQAASSALLGMENQRRLLKTTAFAAVVSLLLDVALIPRWGAPGAALANTVSQAIWAVSSFWPLWTRITSTTKGAIARAAVVVTVLASLLEAFLLLKPPLLVVLVGGAIAMLAYVLLLDRMKLISTRSLVGRLTCGALGT
jgi:O-antigen/teichoic acid export membrane protein